MKDKERARRRKKFEEDYKPAYDAFIALYPFTLENLDGEIWLPIPDFEGYHGSNFGRVKSFHKGKVKILKPLFLNKYLAVQLSTGGKKKFRHVHRLGAQLFIPNPDNLPQGDHRFGMKFDCSVWNLRWATQAQNNQYAFDMGLIKSGEDCSYAKLTNEQVRYIRENPDGLNLDQLAEKFGVANTVISAIQRGKTYKNVGGSIRAAQKPGEYRKISDEKRAQILADYQRGVKGHGYTSVGKRFGVDAKTVWNIVNGIS